MFYKKINRNREKDEEFSPQGRKRRLEDWPAFNPLTRLVRLRGKNSLPCAPLR
jgi:hypothetical protein